MTFCSIRDQPPALQDLRGVRRVGVPLGFEPCFSRDGHDPIFELFQTNKPPERQPVNPDCVSLPSRCKVGLSSEQNQTNRWGSDAGTVQDGILPPEPDRRQII